MTQKKTRSNSSKQRIPRQERSKARVEAILNATKDLIQEKGSAALKIKEIAGRAGISAGSMYQYFPDKQAIIHTLLDEYIDSTEALFANTLTEINSVSDLSTLLTTVQDQYYSLYRNTPVYQDIVASRSVDKSINKRDIEDSRNNSSAVFEASKHLFEEDQHAALQHYLLLLMHIAPSIMRLAINLEPEEAESVMQISRKLLSEAVIELFLQSDTETEGI